MVEDFWNFGNGDWILEAADPRKMSENKRNEPQVCSDTQRATSASKRPGTGTEPGKQEVELVEEDAKLEHLLSALGKSSPPTVVLASSKKTVEAIHQYLESKNSSAVCVHGGKGMEEREMAFQLFQSGQRDILVTTIIMLRGVYLNDFMKHVINYDMPHDIDTYIHIAGIMASSGQTTTFISKDTSQPLLRDLKAALIDSNQKVPECLESLLQHE